MGTPDIQGTNGTYSYYTNNPPPEWETATGGKVYLVDVIDGVVDGLACGVRATGDRLRHLQTRQLQINCFGALAVIVVIVLTYLLILE